MSSTNGGNPLSCRGALAAIEIIERERLPERAMRLDDEIDGPAVQAKKGTRLHLGSTRALVSCQVLALIPTIFFGRCTGTSGAIFWRPAMKQASRMS